MIFSYFGVRGHHQARILKWGIIGALVMRAIFIFAGVGLLARFHCLFYLFGALLVVTAFKMAFGGEGKVEPEKNLMVRAIRPCFSSSAAFPKISRRQPCNAGTSALSSAAM